MHDTIKVTLANGGTITLIHIADLVPMAQLSLITLSAAYTLWKWRRESKTKGPKQ